VESFRPRSGFTATLAASAVSSVQVPASAREAIVNASANYGRVLVSDSATPPAVTDTSFGYLVTNIPITMKLVQGRDTYIHFSSTVADNVVTVTFGN
jgi:hypothetical protein